MLSCSFAVSGGRKTALNFRVQVKAEAEQHQTESRVPRDARPFLGLERVEMKERAAG